MTALTLIEAGEERLSDIQPLWEGLNRLHAEATPHFKSHFESYTFATRKTYLETKAQTGRLRIFLAMDEDTPVGYCVTSLCSGHGEIESIFIMDAYRGRKMGDTLMRAALAWLDAHGAETKSVNVVYGNEVAHPFYAKYGFLPRSTTLSQRQP